MKKIPIGIDDFKELIEENYYFVDKSLFVKDILEDSSKVLFLPRPRRFGKSLNMSMLNYFLDIRGAEANKNLFEGLKLNQEKETLKYQGNNPVIYISLKDIKARTWEDCLFKIKWLIQNLFREHKYLLSELDEFDANDFKRFITGDITKAQLEDSLRFFSQFLSKHYNKRVYILIDEYDQGILSSYTGNYFEEGIDFFRNLYSAALKGNPYLEKGVLTGILRISKESIFSGLNNLYVDSLLTNQINYFGLSEKEVENILNYYQMNYQIEQVKDWYNGYKFGADFLYNPWSIINFIKTKELKAHWVNTSSNDLIKSTLSKISEEEYEEFINLINSEAVEISIQENISFDGIDESTTVWNLMLFSGYLTLDQDKRLRFPNREIKDFYISYFKTLASNNISKFDTLLNYLVNKKLKAFETLLRKLFFRALSFYDTDTEVEKYYHNLMLGLAFGLESKYIIHSNREYGIGRVDLLLKSKDGRLPDFIFEFKVSTSDSNLEKLAEDALAQIDKKKYAVELENPVKIGMAFYKKEFAIIWEDVS